jgi:hypothetical protein
MRAIYIIVEGQTEEEFVNSVLLPFFNTKGIYDVRPILPNTSKTQKGGALSYARFKHNIQQILQKEKDVLVTSLIDFFRLKNDFPQYHEASKIQDKNQRVAFLENAISEDIQNGRFVPYIQLHEFEGLLFSHIRGFQDIPNADLAQIKAVIESFENPELINDGAETAPSKRLKVLIPKYDKVLHGSFIAIDTGLNTILKKCPRFKAWTEEICNSFSK